MGGVQAGAGAVGWDEGQSHGPLGVVGKRQNPHPPIPDEDRSPSPTPPRMPFPAGPSAARRGGGGGRARTATPLVRTRRFWSSSASGFGGAAAGLAATSVAIARPARAPPDGDGEGRRLGLLWRKPNMRRAFIHVDPGWMPPRAFMTSMTSSSVLSVSFALSMMCSSIPTSPNSFSMTANRRPPFSSRLRVRRWFSRVVLPEPRKPVSTVHSLPPAAHPPAPGIHSFTLVPTTPASPTPSSVEHCAARR